MSKETTQASKIDNGWLPVHLLASNGNTLDIYTLAQSGADINVAIESQDSFNGFTPAILAVQSGHVETLLLIARLGADLDVKVSGMSALMHAIQHKTRAVELTKTLIAMGADTTLLAGAVAQHGVNILSQLNVGESFVKDLGEVFSDTEIVKAEYAEQHEISLITFKSEEEEIDIGKAFSECDIETVVKYVKDTSIPEANKYGGNLFYGAAMQSTPEYTKMMIALIQAGYDIARADSEDITTYERLKSIEPANGVALCLLGANADISDEINVIGEDGMNDVHRAIKTGKEQTLSILLASGGDPNMPMSDGTLPITLAMQSKLNMSEMFYVLVKNGADISGFDIEAVESLESLGTVIDPKTTKYIAAARDGSLSDLAMDANMKIADKSFWQEIALMSLDQVSIIIGKFMSGDFNISDLPTEESVPGVLGDPSYVEPGSDINCLGAGVSDSSHDYSDVQ